MQFRRVDFPAPDGPKIAVMPSSNSPLTSSEKSYRFSLRSNEIISLICQLSCHCEAALQLSASAANCGPRAQRFQ